MPGEHHDLGWIRTHLSTVGVPVLIAVGGFVGANLRHALGGAFPGLAGTLVANVAGSFALGVLLYEATFAGRLSRETRLLLGTGLLSSFTTYSTFVVSTYVLGFAGVLVGREVARRVAGGDAGA